MTVFHKKTKTREFCSNNDTVTKPYARNTRNLMSQTLDRESTLNTDHASSHWTLADFFSTYRFWALFLALLLVVVSRNGLNVVVQEILINDGFRPIFVGIFYGSAQCAWIIGAVIAFAVASRCPRAALVVPIVICAIALLALQWKPDLLGSPVFLVMLGLLKGVVVSAFTLVGAIFLVGGRPSKLDFACAFVLVSTPLAISSIVSPIAFGMLLYDNPDGRLAIWVFLAGIVLAGLMLLPCKQLAFDNAPRIRHQPLPARQRSPLIVSFLTMLIIIALVAAFIITLLHYLDSGTVSDMSEGTIDALTLLGVIALCGLLYFAYWIYRIHGELADAAASPRLLTPPVAMLIGLFAPLGLPILLMTLGDLLNDRARANGTGNSMSITWLIIFCAVLPPVAMGMIQHAANKARASR